MFFKLILEGGHLGAGKSYDIVRYFKGRDIVSVLTWAFHIPRAKKKERGKGVKLIKEISKREYLLGKMREKGDPYLNPPIDAYITVKGITNTRRGDDKGADTS